MSEKIVSQLNADGIFVTAVVADESPLEPGVFLIPGGAVDCPPPDVPQGMQARWNGEDFTLEPIPEPEVEPAPVESREDAIKRVWGLIKGIRECYKAGGVKVGEKWFHSDDGSRIQLMGLVMMGANLPAGLQWKTMDGSFIAMTPALAQQVFTGQAASDQTIFAVAEAHRAALEASADPAAYDFSTGWPKVFGEA